MGHHRAHVGIIGGGIAGLRCADVLLQQGFRVTIVEGRKRLGGRMYQERLANGKLVDMGPNWIHGTKNNPILDLAKETQTILAADMESDDQTGAIFDANGEMLPLEDGEALSTAMWNIIEEAFVHSHKNGATISVGESLRDFFEQRVDQHMPKDVKDKVKWQQQLLQMAEFWGAFIGSPVQRQSLKFFWLEECIEGENLFCAGTYKKVLDKLIAPVLEKATVLFEHTVAKIHGRSENESQQPVQLTLTDGNVLSFDEVVVTSPLGWLQHHTDAFEPPLPPRLTQAISSIGYSTLDKVYVSFSSAFWQKPNPEADGRQVRGFCQWLAPGVYAQQTINKDGWPQEAVDMAGLPGGDDITHPTLLFYIFGDQSRALADALATKSDKDSKFAFLCDQFQPYYSCLPHFDPASSECQVVDAIATVWAGDELAGYGSYSNFPVGLEAGDEDIRVMREGLPERGVWLAGEHTGPFVALGTATGAYWSGEAVAQRIGERMDKA